MKETFKMKRKTLVTNTGFWKDCFQCYFQYLHFLTFSSLSLTICQTTWFQQSYSQCLKVLYHNSRSSQPCMFILDISVYMDKNMGWSWLPAWPLNKCVKVIQSLWVSDSLILEVGLWYIYLSLYFMRINC